MGETKTSPWVDLHEVLLQEDGVIRLEISAGMLPPFLQRAYQRSLSAVSETTIDDLILPQDLDFVEQAARERHAVLPAVYLVLALVYQRFERLKTASQWYERLLDLQDHELIYDELIGLFQKLMLYARALEVFKRKQAFLGRALHDDPDYVHLLMQTGQVDRAMELLESRRDRVFEDHRLHSYYLILQQYLPQVRGQEIGEARLQWGQRHAPLAWARNRHIRDLDPDRRLRVGFLSADFRCHSVSYTYEALLDHCDRSQWECFGYGSVSGPDDVTRRLQGKFDHYRDIVDRRDEAVADWIDEDRIDILVALAGHTAGHRLKVLAYKPAPIQIDSGALATTGIAQVDYRMTDDLLDPPSSPSQGQESLVRLPGGALCYRPDQDVPEVQALPMLRNGYVTFGSFNNLPKITDRIIAVWSQILKTLPEARLLLKFPGSGDPALAAMVRHRFAQVGVTPERVLVVGYCRNRQDHLRCYQQVDIALDSFPYNGCVTSLEGFLMGVPLVSWYADRWMSRAGLSLLTALGLGTFAVDNPRDYVARAVTLARQPEVLAKLQGTLRSHFLRGPLCDGQRYAQQWQTATRQMWRRWADRRKQG